MNARYQVTDDDRQIVAMMLCRPESAFRQSFTRIDGATRRRLPDLYYELARNIPRLPGGLTPARQGAQSWLYDFSYRLGDMACDYLERLRYRVPNKWPAYGAEIARLRARGRVPAPRKGVHVSIALRFAYRRAALGACVVVEPAPDFESFDYRLFAGLDVEIMAVRADLDFADWLTRTMAADGVRKITLRRLDCREAAPETLFDAGRPWSR